MAVDPFQLVARNNASLDEQAARDNSQAQDALMTMFRMEAQRQLPYATLPADVAQANAVNDHSLGNQMKLARYNALLGQGKEAQKWANMAPSDIVQIINEESKAAGIDSDILVTLADIETGGKFNANAKNPKSSAGGLFQQTDDNWADYGGGGNRYDPRQSTIAAARFARANIAELERNGIPVNAGTVYLAHQQGPAGAVALLRNPDAPAASIVGPEAVRLNGGRPGMTAGEFAKIWTDKAQRNYESRVALKRRKTQQAGGYEYRMDDGSVIKLGAKNDSGSTENENL